jgi:hypothetical protein
MSAAAIGDSGGAEPTQLKEQRVLLEPRHPPPDAALNSDGAVDVIVRSHVMSLSSIDSLEQRFEAAVWLQARAVRHAFAGARALTLYRARPAA